MNEIDLIKEVEKRAILYDKTVRGFNKSKLRDDAWKEVQEALNVPELECKKRWRSLRDSFIKLQRTHGGRTRWPYHNAMRFLLPHIETKSDFGSKRDTSDSEHEEEVKTRPGHSLPDLSCNYTKQFDDDDDDDDDDEDDSQPSKKARLNSTEEQPCQCNRTDPDELFLLSCSPTLKRLNAKQNAVARLKIQQVLYEAEFGTQMELLYVTPTSENGYENGVGSVE